MWLQMMVAPFLCTLASCGLTASLGYSRVSLADCIFIHPDGTGLARLPNPTLPLNTI